MNIDDMKNKISMELKNPITQQGFEIICKHLTEKENEKCELLGIIQDKDNAIKKLIADMAGLEEELTEKDKQIEELKKSNLELLDFYEKKLNKVTELEAQIDYAKSIIKSILDNSDEYAEQRAREFLKE